MRRASSNLPASPLVASLRSPSPSSPWPDLTDLQGRPTGSSSSSREAFQGPVSLSASLLLPAAALSTPNPFAVFVISFFSYYPNDGDTSDSSYTTARSLLGGSVGVIFFFPLLFFCIFLRALVIKCWYDQKQSIEGTTMDVVMREAEDEAWLCGGSEYTTYPVRKKCGETNQHIASSAGCSVRFVY